MTILGVIMGIAIVVTIMSLTIFLIYYLQPEFLCDLCKCPNPFIFDWFP